MNTKAIKHILTFLFAAYFLLVGVGYNVVNYCCNSCADEGIETIATSSCNAVHHQNEDNCCDNNHEDIACQEIDHFPPSCHLLRLSIDTPSLSTNIITFSIVSIDLFYPVLNLLIDKLYFDSQSINHPPQNHFFSSGREILTLNAVLLI